MSLKNQNTGMEAPTRQPMDIFHPDMEDEDMIEYYDTPTPPRRPMRREPPTQYTTDDIMNSLSDLKMKISNMTMSCSAAPERIREEGDKLIQEFHNRYSGMTDDVESSFRKKSEEIEQKFYEKMNVDFYRLKSLVDDIVEAETKLFKFNTFKRFMFWFGCFTNIGTFSVLLALLVLNYL